ncbi:MAG: hypothetical protein KDD37_07425 [Bdellovibrionales bacterium]|nr:hypothetical protein [Bdellovibrionales bacterium]
MQDFTIATFYRFSPIPKDSLLDVKNKLIEKAEALQIKGLVIMGIEGINTTLAAEKNNLDNFISYVSTFEGFKDLSIKFSSAPVIPFRRFKVQIRDEIVTLNRPDLLPNEKDPSHLSPQEWNEVLKKEQDYILIDTRNWYETEVGKFKNALTPPITEFTDFPKWLETQNIPKEKKVLIYCTGGIRCEKAQVEMKEHGYNNVFQLKDGILKYLEEFPQDQFEGECFVFDHRVAVDQELKPSKVFDLCPHCGQPSKNEITCVKCDTVAKVCERCLSAEAKFETCSKNCAHHYVMNPNKKIRKHTNSISVFRDSKKLILNNTKAASNTDYK